MFKTIKKKIISVSDRVTSFVRNNIGQVITVGGVFILLEVIKSFPYVNIIPSYQFLVIGLVLFLTAIVFRDIISDKIITIMVISLFAGAAVVSIFEQSLIADLIGFIIFILLLFVALRGMISNRKFFKREFDE